MMANIKEVKTKNGTGQKIQYYDSNGVRKSKTVYVSRKEAEKYAARLEVKKSLIKAGLAPDPISTMPLERAVDEYIDKGTRSKAAETIKREEKVYISLKAAIGNIQLGKITPKQIEKHINDRLDSGVSPAGVGLELRTIKAFFNYQIKMKSLNTNPAAGIDSPKQVLKPIRFLTREEVQDLLDVVDDPNYKDLILAYLNSGARRQELLAEKFTWDNVQFKLKRIKLIGKGDKIRFVPMNKTLLEILKRRKADGHEFPFQMDYHWMFKKIKGYYEDAEIENANVHTLRKTFGSLLIAEKVDVFRVSRLLGHSSVTVTQSHYVDILEDDLAATVCKLDLIFTKKKDQK
jgi:site-specific recombinase XerD